jgi:hypothetical protein
LEKPTQVDTPIETTVAAAEWVTVVDPRHPLHDQSFPLLHLTRKHNLIPCCRVQLAANVTRLIPISATNLAAARPEIFPLPVDLASLHNLINVFTQIQAQVDQEACDGTTTDDAVSPRPSDPAHGSVGDVDGHAASSGAAEFSAGLPATGGGLEAGGDR